MRGSSIRSRLAGGHGRGAKKQDACGGAASKPKARWACLIDNDDLFGPIVYRAIPTG
jgi:hypothetical protein